MHRTTVAAALAALSLAACGRDEPHSVTVAPLPAGVEEAAPPTSTAPPRTVEGRYTPLSATAERATGPVQVSKTELRFEEGQILATAPEGIRFSNERHGVGGESWAAMMQVPELTFLEVRRVTSARSPTLEGGLCGSRSVTFVAIALEPQDGGSDELAIAAFTGDAPPTPTAPAEALCATYRYSRE